MAAADHAGSHERKESKRTELERALQTSKRSTVAVQGEVARLRRELREQEQRAAAESRSRVATDRAITLACSRERAPEMGDVRVPVVR